MKDGVLLCVCEDYDNVSQGFALFKCAADNFKSALSDILNTREQKHSK